MKTTDKMTYMHPATRAALRRDKAIAFAGIGLLMLCGADLMARGVDSLYGRFFIWLVSVVS